MERSLLLIIALSLNGCASWFSTRPDAAQIAKRREAQKKDFAAAQELLSSSRYEEAEEAFENFVKKHPTSDMELLAYFNLASAEEALGRCSKAAETYRHVVKSAKGKNEDLEAQALFRLSYTYECLKQDAKVIATLRDLEKRKRSLSDELALAEWPARLAAAYARVGNRRLAEKYFTEAEEGLKTINSRTRDPKKKKDILARTLFFMGSMEKQKFEAKSDDPYMQSLKYLQNYLLKSVELETDPWSSRASDQILALYDSIYEELNKNAAANSEEKKSMAEQALAALVGLKNMRFPDEHEPKGVQQLFAQVDVKEKRFRSYLEQIEVRNPLTPETKERHGLKRQGVIKD